jgi:hypothetical protein
MGKKTVYPGRAAAVAALERAAAKEIKAYFTDWTEYDKPDLLDTEKTPDGTTRYLLTRTCGSYLLNPEERAEIAAQILEYYQTQDASLRKLRRIEIRADRVTVETVDPARTLAAWAKLVNENRNETRAA